MFDKTLQGTRDGLYPPFHTIKFSGCRSLRRWGLRRGGSAGWLLAGGISSASSRLCSFRASKRAVADVEGALRAAFCVSDNPQFIPHITTHSAAIPAQARRHGQINSRHTASAARTGNRLSICALRAVHGAFENAVEKACVR